jgi:hypothetical protein
VTHCPTCLQMSNELDEENPQVNVSGPSETINQDEGRVKYVIYYV